MFVQLRLKTQGAVIVAAGFALGACTEPTAGTDLRPDGAPEVLAVLVMNDADSGLLEHATFCKIDDEKRPGLVGTPDGLTQQVCADDLTLGATEVDDAVPTGWYVRIMFDELLNPDIEELIPITEDEDMNPATPETPTGTFNGSLLNTQPVVLTCTAPGSATADVVPYDGYYTPGGNNVTWPLGPSLFIQPVDLTTVAAGSTCTVTLNNNIVDKDGLGVPADQLGGYTLKLADLAFVNSDPKPAKPGKEAKITADAPVLLTFNGFISAATLAAGEVKIFEGPTCDTAITARTAVITADPDNQQAVDLAIVGATVADNLWNEDVAYVVTFADGAAVADLAGATADLPGAADFTLCFKTVAP